MPWTESMCGDWPGIRASSRLAEGLSAEYAPNHAYQHWRCRSGQVRGQSVKPPPYLRCFERNPAPLQCVQQWSTATARIETDLSGR